MRNVLILAVLFAAPGCTLVKSTMVSRQDDNSFVGQSNGEPQEHGKTRPFRGVPVALKVPTHVDVKVTETYFIQADGVGEERKLREVVFDDPKISRNLNVTITPITTKKLFTVDFVRPAAGTLDYSAEFTDEQYFSSIENTITDETIKDITAAIKEVAPTLGLPAAARIGTALTNKLITGERTVAFARFDIDAPDFEDQLNEFLTVQVTGCHQCGGRTTLDGTCPTGACPAETLPEPAASNSRSPASDSVVDGLRLPQRTSAQNSEPYFSTPEYTVYPYAE